MLEHLLTPLRRKPGDVDCFDAIRGRKWALSDHLSLRHQGSEQKPNFILLVRLKTSVDTPAFLIRSFPDGIKGKSKTKPPILDFVSRSLRGLPGSNKTC